MVACTSFFFSFLCLCGWLSSNGGVDSVSTMAAIAYNQRQQEMNTDVLPVLSVTEEIS